MELAEKRSSSLSPEPIVCGSIQSLCSKARLDRIDPMNYSLLILDEAHMGISETWQRVANHFRQNPDLRVLCLTATPARHDKKKLSGIVDAIAYEYSLKDAIADGWLVLPKQRIQYVPGLDLSKIARAGRELNQKQLADTMLGVAELTAHRSIEAIYGLFPHELDAVPQDNWSHYIGDRRPKRTIAFTVNVKHAEVTAEVLNKFRPGLCVWGSGEMAEDQINEVFSRFESGDAACFANCGLTIMGFDDPKIELILDIAPTLSHTRAMQKFGRSTRPLPGIVDGLATAEERKAAIASSAKPHATIIDFAGNSGKHKLVTLIDIFGDKQPAHIQRELRERAKRGEIDVQAEVGIIQADIALRHTDFAETVVDGFTGKRKKKKKKRDPNAKKKAPSNKMLDYLKKQKLHPERRTEEQNRELYKKCQHRRLAGLCSYAQGFTLMKYGYSREQMQTMKFRDASNAIQAIANNGWKRPAPSTEGEPAF